MSDATFFNVGKIVNTHGIKGEVKVIRITDFEERFAKGSILYLQRKQSHTPIQLTVKQHRRHKQFDLLMFESYDTISDVEPFKEGMLMIKEDQLHPLEDGDYYYFEIIGCEIYTMADEHVGTVKEILSPGANDVWVVQRPQQKDVLIPYIEDIVKEINISEKKIRIEPMEGLLD